MDHFSRRVMGITAFKSQPTSDAVRAFLGTHDCPRPRKPRDTLYAIAGKQFDCSGFRTWCHRKGVNPPRYGAIGHHGSIAVVERAILTMKCLLARLLFVSYRRDAFMRELTAAAGWHNEHRPHSWLRGQTPNERYYGKFPANRRPRFEPRDRWQRGSPCAKPWALVRGSPGTKLTIEVSFHCSRKHLPVVKLHRAA